MTGCSTLPKWTSICFKLEQNARKHLSFKSDTIFPVFCPKNMTNWQKTNNWPPTHFFDFFLWRWQNSKQIDLKSRKLSENTSVICDSNWHEKRLKKLWTIKIASVEAFCAFLSFLDFFWVSLFLFANSQLYLSCFSGYSEFFKSYPGFLSLSN